MGCGITAYGCYTLFISGGAKLGLVGGVVGAIGGATAGAIAAAFFCGYGVGTCAQGETTLPGKLLKKLICRPVVASCDPNEIIGPTGYGDSRMVARDTLLPYTILYENDSAFATTAAQRVTVRQKIDPHLDPSSFRLGGFGFGNKVFDVPANLSNYTATLNLADSLGFNVNVTAGLDIVNQELFWVFQTIDPQTGLPPADPFSGYLPVNDSTKRGEGFVRYTIRALNTAVTGDSVKAKAEIVFDINAPIETNTAVNIVDAGRPLSLIKPGSTVEYNSVITLPVEASDDHGGSGVQFYALHYSENGGPFTLYRDSLTASSVSFTGKPGSTYCFYTQALDNVGNREPEKTQCLSIALPQKAILPVTWLTFNARQYGRDVVLNWTTAMEKDAREYVIERSVDGRRFRDVGSVPAAGNSSSTRGYDYTDANAATTSVRTLYYRLRQVDLDGRFTYSTIVAVPLRQVSVTEVVKAYPNPFRDHITIRIISVTTVSESDHVGLYDANGKMVYQRRIKDRRSETVLLNNLPPMAAGAYLLKVALNGTLYTLTLIKE